MPLPWPPSTSTTTATSTPPTATASTSGSDIRSEVWDSLLANRGTPLQRTCNECATNVHRWALTHSGVIIWRKFAAPVSGQPLWHWYHDTAQSETTRATNCYG